MSVTTLRMVVGGLILVLMTSVGGIIALSLANPQRSIPDVLQNIAVGALTALAGILVRTGSNDQPDPPRVRGQAGRATIHPLLTVGLIVLAAVVLIVLLT